MPLFFGFQITFRTMLATASRPATRPVAGKGSVEPGALRAGDIEDGKMGEGSQVHTGSWSPANLDVDAGRSADYSSRAPRPAASPQLPVLFII